MKNFSLRQLDSREYNICSGRIIESAIAIPLLKDSKILINQTLKPLLSYVDVAGFKYVENRIDKVIPDIVPIAHASITRRENEKKQEGDKK